MRRIPMSSLQAPKAVIMIRPWRFHPNPETAGDNAFQRETPHPDMAVASQARAEFDRMVETLQSHGGKVHVFDDYGEHETPDSVFPNNWFSTHPGGHIAIYPMYSPSRRRERRSDVMNMLKSEYRVQDIIDLSGLEWDELFLEGTGAMVLDHFERVAYTANSLRANPIVLERFCSHFHFEPMAFDAFDRQGNPVYHTNVLMTIGTDFALVGSRMIADEARRKEVIQRLEGTGRVVIDLDFSQIEGFAGNALELTGKEGRILVLSQKAFDVLTPDQIKIIEPLARIVPLEVPTIELAGGSVRCMLAGIHLTRRGANL